MSLMQKSFSPFDTSCLVRLSSTHRHGLRPAASYRRPPSEQWRLFGQDQRGVVATKGKGVGQRHPDGSRPRLVGHIIQITLRVGVLQVDGRREHPLMQGQQRSGGFHRPGRPQAVAVSRFGGTDRNRIGS